MLIRIQLRHVVLLIIIIVVIVIIVIAMIQHLLFFKENDNQFRATKVKTKLLQTLKKRWTVDELH